MGRRRKYTKEFKRDAVNYVLSHPEMTITDVAIKLGIDRTLLSHWKREFQEHDEKAFPGNGNPRDEELYKLRKELAELKEENIILKKAAAIFSKGNL